MSVLELPVGELTELATRTLRGLGTPVHIADVVAASLVIANQMGHDSHGVVRLLEYSTFVSGGRVRPDAEPTVVGGRGVVTVIDGNHGWGQYASRHAVDRLIETAAETGAAVVSIRNCNHIGRLGEYSELLAAAGLVSVILCNADPCVAPYGGRERMLGTNPVAAGVPVAGQRPVVLDFATASVAEGKLRVARATGERVAPGAIIDRDGLPSTDPGDFYDGGALLPFGEHKGYGLSVLAELLGGGLSGNHPSVASRYGGGNGVVMTAYDPAAFGERADFDRDMVETAERLRASQPAHADRPVLLPGDVEAAAFESRRDVVPVAEEIWAALTELMARVADDPRQL